MPDMLAGKKERKQEKLPEVVIAEASSPSGPPDQTTNAPALQNSSQPISPTATTEKPSMRIYSALELRTLNLTLSLIAGCLGDWAMKKKKRLGRYMVKPVVVTHPDGKKYLGIKIVISLDGWNLKKNISKDGTTIIEIGDQNPVNEGEE